MTTAAFNGMLGEFLSQMLQTRAKLKLDVEDISTAIADLEASGTERIPLDNFYRSISPHKALVQARNPDNSFDEETFKQFLEAAKDSNLMASISIHEFWNKLPESSKQGIWKFMNQLFTMAIAISAIPAGMLSQIENMAQSLVSQQMTGDSNQMPNPADLAQMLGSMASMGAGPPNITGGLQQNPMLSMLDGFMPPGKKQ